MTVALSTYISFLDRDGVSQDLRFQNFFPDQARDYEGQIFQPAGFGYTGAAVDIQAANVEASLVFLVTDLLLDFVDNTAMQQWLVSVWTVWLDPETLEETSDRLEEVYAISSYSHNQRELVMTLSSPLDAQTAELPARVLSRAIVGNLPPTGAVPFI